MIKKIVFLQKITRKIDIFLFFIRKTGIFAVFSYLKHVQKNESFEASTINSGK